MCRSSSRSRCTPQIPEVKEFLAEMKKIDKAPVEVAASGWILADELYNGLKLAGPEFTQKKVIDGLNTVKDYSDNGFIAPIDWTIVAPGSGHAPGRPRSARVRELHPGEEREVRRDLGQPGKPWNCFKNNAPKLVPPTYMSFVPKDSGSN